MTKKGFGYNLSTGLKGFTTCILSMLIMLIPAWFIKYLYNVIHLIVIGAVLMIMWVLFYLVIWGWSWNWLSKWWK
jgi:hypothetical protein